MKIYVDGSCRKDYSREKPKTGNIKYPTIGGYGIVIYDDKNNFIDCVQSDILPDVTNNRMELSAILWVMENYGMKENVNVYSDSAYAINCLESWCFKWANNYWVRSNGLEPENLDIVQRYYELYMKGYRLHFVKVKGHQGNEGNEFADKLATHSIDVKDLFDFYKKK